MNAFRRCGRHSLSPWGDTPVRRARFLHLCGLIQRAQAEASTAARAALSVASASNGAGAAAADPSNLHRCRGSAGNSFPPLGTGLACHPQSTLGLASARGGLEASSRQAVCRGILSGYWARRTHRYSQPRCATNLATISHVFVTCPIAAGIWTWFYANLAAITGEAALPRRYLFGS